MLNRKITLLYSLPIVLMSVLVGMIIASRLDLSPATERADRGGAADEQRAAHRAADGLDLPRHRQAGVAGRGQHPHRVAAAHAGPVRLLRRGGGGDLFERFFGQPNPARAGAGRRPGAAAAAARARAGGAGGRHRLHHRQGRLHPHQQPRRGRRHQDRRVALRRGRGSGIRGPGRRPRPAHRQRAHRAHRKAQPHAPRDQVRRFHARCSRATG